VDLYSAFIVVPHTQGAQVRITQCYLQITPYLPLPRKRSPDGVGFNPPLSSGATHEICAEPMRKYWGTPRNVVPAKTEYACFSGTSCSILVQRRPKLGIWRWVEGLAKWIGLNTFTNLRYLGCGQDPTLNLRCGSD